jgi:hypothetical protein
MRQFGWLLVGYEGIGFSLERDKKRARKWQAQMNQRASLPDISPVIKDRR